MRIYINGEFCSSLEQLKWYFSENLTPESDIYLDLLDYGRHGDITVWLRERNETELSSKVEAISEDLSDSDFYAQLKEAITGIMNHDSLRPTFDRCFSFEGLKCDMKDNEAKVLVSLKVLMCVNEKYELSVSSNWGTRGVIINPNNYPEGKTACFDFTLHKRPGKDVGEITVKVDGKVLSQYTGNSDEIQVGDDFGKKEIMANRKNSSEFNTIKKETNKIEKEYSVISLLTKEQMIGIWSNFYTLPYINENAIFNEKNFNVEGFIDALSTNFSICLTREELLSNNTLSRVIHLLQSKQAYYLDEFSKRISIYQQRKDIIKQITANNIIHIILSCCPSMSGKKPKYVFGSDSLENAELDIWKLSNILYYNFGLKHSSVSSIKKAKNIDDLKLKILSWQNMEISPATVSM